MEGFLLVPDSRLVAVASRNKERGEAFTKQIEYVFSLEGWFFMIITF